MDDRRRFERVHIPDNARLSVLDHTGRKLGPVRILGRGGMLFWCSERWPSGTVLNLKLRDEVEDVTRDVSGVVRYSSPEGVGCEFEKLDVEAAIEIGVWIGKYFAVRI